MPRKPTAKDFARLTAVRDRLAASLRKFDLYPNRGLDLAYQPRLPRSLMESMHYDSPIDCRHGVRWTDCTQCSKSAGVL
jgi:hypothetical protein